VEFPFCPCHFVVHYFMFFYLLIFFSFVELGVIDIKCVSSHGFITFLLVRYTDTEINIFIEISCSNGCK